MADNIKADTAKALGRLIKLARKIHALKGVIGRTVAMDKLDMTVVQATKVMCVRCGQHIYYLKNDSHAARLDNLAPLAGRQQPSSWDCPKCGRIFPVFMPEISLKTNKGYMQ